MRDEVKAILAEYMPLDDVPSGDQEDVSTRFFYDYYCLILFAFSLTFCFFSFFLRIIRECWRVVVEAAVWKWVEEFKSFSVLFCGGVVRSELDERVRAMRLVKQAIYKKDYDYGMLDEVLIHVRRNSLEELPLIGVYYHCYHMLVSENEETHFRKFIEIIQGDKKSFTKSDLTSLYRLAINYCIKKWNSGEKEYMQEVFDWYRKGLQREVLLEDGFLSRFTYKNILTAGLLVNESEWVFNFLNDYKKTKLYKYHQIYAVQK